MNFVTIVYNILIFPVFFIFARVYKLFNKKFKSREENSLKHLKEISKLKKTKPRIWIHSASMGEFEQAKPIIELLKSRLDCEIIATFFSPSGYENQSEYQYIDHRFYLPLDTLVNAKNFVNYLEPNVAIFIRYEIWHNFLSLMHHNNIPLLLVAATKPNSKTWGYPFLKDFYKYNLNLFSAIYSAGKTHKDYFLSLGLDTTVIGLNDTRYDRVHNAVKNYPKSDNKSSNKLKIVLGSSWTEDEELFLDVDDKFQLIIAPHEPSNEHISRLQDMFPNHILFSEIHNRPENIEDRTIIVDSVGHLLKIYSIADIAYVGGGFGAGLHSVSEPAAYGVPVIVGGNKLKSIDANILKQDGGLFVISDKNELNSILNELTDEKKREHYGMLNYKFIKERIGSSKKIVDDIIELIKTSEH